MSIDPARPARSDRRDPLRRAEDCVHLLEAAELLGAIAITPAVRAALSERLPTVTLGMPIGDALGLARALRDAEPSGIKREHEHRLTHRRAAFDHELLLGDLFPCEGEP